MGTLFPMGETKLFAVRPGENGQGTLTFQVSERAGNRGTGGADGGGELSVGEADIEQASLRNRFTELFQKQ